MDEQLFRRLQPLLLNALSEYGWSLITSWALPGLVFVAAALWAQRERRLQTLLICVACGLLAESLNSQIIKSLFAAPRPCLQEGLSLLSRCSPTYSMPSSHAVSIVAGLLPLSLAWRRAAAPLAIAALLFIASRLALGMHWPSDLLVGAVIGAIIGLAGWRLENRLAAR